MWLDQRRTFPENQGSVGLWCLKFLLPKSTHESSWIAWLYRPQDQSYHHTPGCSHPLVQIRYICWDVHPLNACRWQLLTPRCSPWIAHGRPNSPHVIINPHISKLVTTHDYKECNTVQSDWQVNVIGIIISYKMLQVIEITLHYFKHAKKGLELSVKLPCLAAVASAARVNLNGCAPPGDAMEVGPWVPEALGVSHGQPLKLAKLRMVDAWVMELRLIIHVFLRFISGNWWLWMVINGY